MLWKSNCPWYCEVRDGLSWFGYCLNKDCVAFRNLFVVNRGFGIFKLENELNEFSCPVCQKENYELRNLGFVNCDWALKGVRHNGSCRIISDGTTYDDKLHTFQEIDYKTSFEFLNIFVKKNTEITVKNISARSELS